jgi:hypothetical protein
MKCQPALVHGLLALALVAPGCSTRGGVMEPAEALEPTRATAPTDTSAPAPTSVSPEREESTEPARTDVYDTAYPLPDDVQNFTGEGGESPVNFQTDLAMDEVIAFYREAFAEMGLVEYDLLTAIEDEGFSMVFTGWPDGEELVIQGVAFGGNTNVNIRLEEVVDS